MTDSSKGQVAASSFSPCSPNDPPKPTVILLSLSKENFRASKETYENPHPTAISSNWHDLPSLIYISFCEYNTPISALYSGLDKFLQSLAFKHVKPGLFSTM